MFIQDHITTALVLRQYQGRSIDCSSVLLFLWFTLQIALKRKLVSQNISAQDVLEEDTVYIVLVDSDIQPYLFEPEFAAKEMQWREVEAVAALRLELCNRKWPAGTKQANCSIPIILSLSRPSGLTVFVGNVAAV